MSKQDHNTVILLPFTLPNFCTNPWLASWRYVLGRSGWGGGRRATAEGVFRWWPRKGSPTIYRLWSSALSFTGLVGSWGAQGVWRAVTHSGGLLGWDLVVLPQQRNKRGVEHFKRTIAFCSSFLLTYRAITAKCKGTPQRYFCTPLLLKLMGIGH